LQQQCHEAMRGGYEHPQSQSASSNSSSPCQQKKLLNIIKGELNKK